MSTIRSALLVLGLAASGPALLEAQTAPPVPEAVRHELLSLEQAWDSAIIVKDVAALDRILAPGFVFIDADGSVTSRQDLLHGIADLKLTIDPFDTHDVE